MGSLAIFLLLLPPLNLQTPADAQMRSFTAALK
jgi:hypothetical protein